MKTTAAQQLAIDACGNVLVAAGAGAGKTSTLVARCLRLLAGGCSLENILMVTFTEAAAAEMRARIRQALENWRDRPPAEGTALSPAALDEQLALIDTAQVSTLHSFCLQLVRRHFHELELDPQLAVLDDAQGRVLMDEVLDSILTRHYRGGALGGRLEELMETFTGGREQPVRDLIFQIHHYTQTQPQPAVWIERQLAVVREPEPVSWGHWLRDALHDWRRRWSEGLRHQPPGNERAHALARQLAALRDDAPTAAFAPVFDSIPRDLKPKERQPGAFFKEADFLRSLVLPRQGVDALAQDWGWSRTAMETLLRLAAEFAEEFALAKREQAALDFHDLEQFALRLLWDSAGEAPTTIGRVCREQFAHVFVDECQDINAAQDAIIRAVSRDGAAGNRFLVGDVKQSIYRFRLADPRIFQRYEEQWRRREHGRVVDLGDNFRSREALLHFFNTAFAALMRREIGGVEFDDSARLHFGAPEDRAALGMGHHPEPRTHLHLRLTSREDEVEGDGDEDNGLAELTGAEEEARLVANELRRLQDTQHEVAARGGGFRPVEWGDMAVLLRSPNAKAGVYAREFARQGIPLEVAQGDFYEALEVQDLLNLLMLLDNPLQDVPLLAVLHSPLVGLSADELAAIRLAARDSHFWTALQRFHDTAQSEAAWARVDQFLTRFQRWRRMARDASLGARLETVLAETHYLDWLEAQAPNPQRAAQRRANVRRLLTLARQFDPFQRQGVPRFLRFVEAQRETATREPAASSGRAVQLISIHRSKGLEYPVVAVPDLGKKFNFADLRGDILLHEELGLCPQIRSPGGGRRYPSLPHWLYGRREKSALLGEELRLLYVALTRARDTLLLFGTVPRKHVEESWPEWTGTTDDLLNARSMLDWLGPWLAHQTGRADWLTNPGASTLFSWHIHEATAEPGTPPPGGAGAIDERLAAPSLADLLSWTYAYAAATRETAKTSVSALRRRLAGQDLEARPLWRTAPREPRPAHGLSAAEIGTAHHTLLELAALSALTTPEGVRTEAEQLVAAGTLSAEEGAALNCRAVARFWSSPVGRRFLQHQARIQRELPFTARFAAADLQALGLSTACPDGEFVIIQGVADLVVILEREIWLLDFKTDGVNAGEVADKVRFHGPQLRTYAAALGRIYGRPVTGAWLHFLATGTTAEVLAAETLSPPAGS